MNGGKVAATAMSGSGSSPNGAYIELLRDATEEGLRMPQNAYSLSDLVDLSLRLPEIGAVNFNILHTVLQTMITELGLENVRPSCKFEHPLLSKTELVKARMKGDARKTRSQDSISFTRRDEPLVVKESASEELQSKPTKPPSSPSEEQEDQEDPLDKDETSPLPPESQPTEDEKKDDEKDQMEATGPGKEPGAQEKAHGRTMDSGKAKQAWKYTQLESRVEAIEEGFMRLTEIIDMLVDKIKKVEATRTQGGPSPEELQKLKQKIKKLEQAFTTLQEDSKKKSSGASSAELEGLEDRIEGLEEAKVVFDQDHETLGEVLKVQNEMMQEFEEIKALGKEIEDMKNEIALKAGMKEMEEALALKGDLSLVLTKVDQTEFETAIEELGEAIGLLGIKFTKKNDEWEQRCAEVWKGVDGKMSREVFDAAVSKIETRLTALMHALKAMKRVVEELLYPDSSGVTRCILCRRPAAISGHECVDTKDNPKRPHKSSEGSSDDSVSMENFLKNVDKAISKKPKVDCPPFDAHRDTIIRIPYCSSTYRTEQDIEVTLKEPALKLAPVSKTGVQSSKTQEVHFSVPKRDSGLPHRKLVFTHKMLEDSNRQDEPQEGDSNPTPETDSASTSSREGSLTSDTTDVMSDSVRNMESFAPMRLMEDPLRREILRSPNAKHRQTPNLTLAPLYPNSTSSRDN